LLHEFSGIKDTKKDQIIEMSNKLSIYESTTIFITQQKELQELQIYQFFTHSQTRNLKLFQFHSSVVVVLPHQK